MVKKNNLRIPDIYWEKPLHLDIQFLYRRTLSDFDLQNFPMLIMKARTFQA